MKNMKKAIEQCMKDYKAAENGVLDACFIFPEDFIGFQGHFPDNKILPGICQIQCVIAVLEKWKGRRAVLREIIVAKFLLPVLPLEELMCTVSHIDESNGAMIMKASFSRDNKKISEIKLKVHFQ